MERQHCNMYPERNMDIVEPPLDHGADVHARSQFHLPSFMLDTKMGCLQTAKARQLRMLHPYAVSLSVYNYGDVTQIWGTVHTLGSTSLSLLIESVASC
jgi:hypothetical protein